MLKSKDEKGDAEGRKMVRKNQLSATQFSTAPSIEEVQDYKYSREQSISSSKIEPAVQELKPRNGRKAFVPPSKPMEPKEIATDSLQSKLSADLYQTLTITSSQSQASESKQSKTKNIQRETSGEQNTINMGKNGEIELLKTELMVCK